MEEDRLCGIVARVSGYRFRDPGFDSRHYHIFWKVVGLERSPLSIVSTTEEKVAAPVYKTGNTAVGIRGADPRSAKVGTNFVDTRQSLDG
jgi:hypothetical protein